MQSVANTCFIDLETASQADLKEVGAWVYSQHCSTTIYCISFAVGDEPVQTWIPSSSRTEAAFFRLQAVVSDPNTVLVAHNRSFEFAVWTNLLAPLYGLPYTPIERWHDTQVLSLAVNLPTTLNGLAQALGSPIEKDSEGAQLMREMAGAVVGTYESGFSHPMATEGNLRRLARYCEIDVEATRECYRRLPPLTHPDQALFDVDARANLRGVYLDREFARACRAVADQRIDQLNKKACDLSLGYLDKATAPPALKAWTKARDVKLPLRARKGKAPTESLDTRAISELLEAGGLPEDVEDIFKVRLEASKVTSLAKLDRVETMTDEGRLRFALQFHGTNTGRWSSYGLQLHNLPKSFLSPIALQLSRDLVEARDLEALEMFQGDPLQTLSQMLRSIVSAPPGRELIAADYSAIEARVVAWLAGQTDILEVFESGQDVYVYAAERVGSPDRQMGKISTLALGFGMGDILFADTAAAWGTHLPLKEARKIKTAWRESNDKIVEFWGLLEEAALCAVQDPGQIYTAGPHIECLANEHVLRIYLPSGRALHYWRPSVVTTTKTIKTATDEGEIQEIEITSPELRYWEAGPKDAMIQTSTYGGKLVENVTQATARELLGHALVAIDTHSLYDIVLHVHDSIACEVDEGTGSVSEFCQIMESKPAWADGLPVAAEGYRETHFRG